MLGGGVTLQWNSIIQGEEEILLQLSLHATEREKCWPDGSLGSCADLTESTNNSVFAISMWHKVLNAIVRFVLLHVRLLTESAYFCQCAQILHITQDMV